MDGCFSKEKSNVWAIPRSLEQFPSLHSWWWHVVTLLQCCGYVDQEPVWKALTISEMPVEHRAESLAERQRQTHQHLYTFSRFIHTGGQCGSVPSSVSLICVRRKGRLQRSFLGEEQRKRADFVIENNGFWAEMLINPTELWLNG